MPVETAEPRKGPDWRAPAIGIGMAIAIIVVIGSCAEAFQGAVDIADGRLGRRPLSPIPVPASACLYLRPVHKVAAELDRQWSSALADASDLVGNACGFRLAP